MASIRRFTSASAMPISFTGGIELPPLRKARRCASLVLTMPMMRSFLTSLAALVVVGAVAASNVSAQSQFKEFLFKTPSNNIYCSAFEWNSLKSGSIDCAVISTGTRTTPPKQWYLGTKGRVTTGRPYEGPISHNKVVPYGTTLKLGLFRCTSRETGLRCWSRLSGHGFSLSRERQKVF